MLPYLYILIHQIMVAKFAMRVGPPGAIGGSEAIVPCCTIPLVPLMLAEA